MARKRSGFVLGKFMPLHAGHEQLLRFASHFVDQLYVVVDRVPDEWVSGDTRVKWVKETVPAAEVFYLPVQNPQDPSEHPDFWGIWRDSLLDLLPVRPDYVFASEHYGFKLAEVLGASFVPFDLGRQTMPISGTAMRNDTMKHWPYLSQAAKKDFTMRVCVFGPESAGKSTLTEKLGAHYQTVAVPEYARFFIEAKKEITQADMVVIAEGQKALEKNLLEKANRILFSDTDALATTIWSRWLFQSCDAELEKLSQTGHFDFYLLMKPDLPWVPDQVRYFPGRSEEFFEDCRNILEKHNLPYAVISGEGDERTLKAVRDVDRAMHDFFAARKL